MTAHGGAELEEGVREKLSGEATVLADRAALGEEDRGRMTTSDQGPDQDQEISLEQTLLTRVAALS